MWAECTDQDAHNYCDNQSYIGNYADTANNPIDNQDRLRCYALFCCRLNDYQHRKSDYTVPSQVGTEDK